MGKKFDGTPDDKTQKIASEYAKALESEIPDDIIDARNKLYDHIKSEEKSD